MIKINEDDALFLELSSGENSLLDARIESVAIKNTDFLCIDLIFKMSENSIYEKILLRFIDVIEFSFFHNNNYVFYNVEDVKFIKNVDNQFYLSLDPSTQDGISERDQDYIVSKSIVAYRF